MPSLSYYILARSAVVSDCGRYRYTLSRSFRDGDPGKRVAFVCLNPSTADASTDDPTTRRVCSFARAWGYQGVDIVNLFAFRATDPRALFELSLADAVGPLNDWHIDDIISRASLVVAAWGAHGTHLDRARKVLDRLTFKHRDVRALHTLSGGEPAHPLYLPADSVPRSYRGPHGG